MDSPNYGVNSMANINLDLEDLGRNIEDIVNRAVSSHDYQKLNQTIRQTVDKVVYSSTETVRRTVTTNRPVKKAEPIPVQKKDLTVLYGKTNGLTSGGVLKIVGGGILSFFGLMLLLSSMVFDFLVSGAVSLAVPAISSLACLLGGGTLIGSGVGTLKKIGRFKAYCKALGQKTVCALETLARSVGKTEKYVRKDVQKMIRSGLFREGHLDNEQTRLITSNETYRNFEHNRLLLEQREHQAVDQGDRRRHVALHRRYQRFLGIHQNAGAKSA